tara:strand:- start:11888 stop:11998 length:111 start_codon:yes stop_codon:yes gene_type:complete
MVLITPRFPIITNDDDFKWNTNIVLLVPTEFELWSQ